MGHLNMHSLRNKCGSIKPIISPNFDIFLVSETKLDESFSNNQFSISGYKTFRPGRNSFGGGLCIYAKENIASKQLNLHFDQETEAICLEINIQLGQCLAVRLFKPSSQNNSLFLENVSKYFSRYLDSYEIITFLGDFNMTPEDKTLQHFTDIFSIEHFSLINEPNCLKGSPSCI